MLALGSSALAMQMARPPLHAAFLCPSSLRMQPPQAAQMKAYDERPSSHIAEGLDVEREEELAEVAGLTFWECPSEEYQISEPADIFAQHNPRRPAGRWWKFFSHDDEFAELEPPPRKSHQGAAPAEVDSDLPAHAPRRRNFWASRVRAPTGGKGAKEEPAPQRRHTGRGGLVTAMEGIGGPAHRHAAADAEALQADARAAEAAAASAVQAAEAAAEVAQDAAFAAQRAAAAARLALESDGEYVTW